MPAALTIGPPRNAVVLGYLVAIAGIGIISAYPAITRISVTTTLTPADLLMLRFGVSGLLFAPYLLLKCRELPGRTWLVGVPLSFFQGWGMAGSVIFGLQYAPASHSAALGPGAISVWIAAFGFVLYGERLALRKISGMAAIVAGVILILASSFRGLSTARAGIGDAMFLAASALGAIYFVYSQHRKIDPVLGAALVSTYSAIGLLPWYLATANSHLLTAPAAEIVWQIVFQGILMGCIAFLALNYAIVTIGGHASGMLLALVPVLGMLFSLALVGDPVSPLDWIAIAAISAGVAIGVRPAPSAHVPSGGTLAPGRGGPGRIEMPSRVAR
jgi:drug/metabolite transporter (DMT)-like permease